MLKVGALLASAALALAGCTVTDISEDGLKSKREIALHDAVVAYGTALVAGDGPQTRQWLSDGCTPKTKGSIERWDRWVLGQAKLTEDSKRMERYAAKIYDNRDASVRYEYGRYVKVVNQDWVWLHDLGWKLDDC